MDRRNQFNPEVTRIKLNPEQAVLTCACFSTGWRLGPGTHYNSVGFRVASCLRRSLSHNANNCNAVYDRYTALKIRFGAATSS